MIREIRDRKEAIKVLQDEGHVIIRCNGGSMRPIIAPGEAIYLKKIDPIQFRVGDAVFCKVKSGLQVHKILDLDDVNPHAAKPFLIGNNHGHEDGWIDSTNIFGVAYRIEDRCLITWAEFNDRMIDRDD